MADGRPPGEYDVTVRAAGMTGRVFEAVVVNPGGHTPLDVRLEPATAALEGLVVDAEGRPLGGAQVRAEPASFSGVAHTALTDAEGAWKLEGLEAGPTSVRARREGSQRWTSRMETLKAGVVTRADFTLADSGSVWGQVTRASGGPLTEPALVHAVPRGGSGTASTETDAQGQFQLELPAGVYQLVALLHQTPAIYFHMESDPFVTVPSGGAVRQDLLLKEDSVLSGVVLEPSGVPSPLAIVAAIQGGDFPMTRKERADEAGQFAMPPRPQGAQPLELVAHNAGRVGRLPAAHEDQAPLTVRLEPAATLRGRVVAGSGAAPEGFTLELLEANGEALPWAGAWPTTRRFAGSTFLLPDAPAQALKVTVRTEDSRTGEAQVTLRPGGTSDVEVPLTGGVASISGRAVWSRGRPRARGGGVPRQGRGRALGRLHRAGRTLPPERRAPGHPHRAAAAAGGPRGDAHREGGGGGGHRRG
ncbi:carboxypeptidase-like regulatory domain-containing protein [Myxococcus sp. MxC21-1]|uniref:carboxypeptidase-like regulatory domain-containing protein n=1 Tax=Myxococcus sp. MxC21-1 TaxID=3041439 RepID=UPI00292E7E4D|nr:carboxypeptidase-like regulatory domain-containing protein [Myxococcus sp. MxC21-1]WNZ61512.1 carboxypeptidase-like regulatory domain-containing protein [Myxococcus sp. MxC21-1]